MEKRLFFSICLSLFLISWQQLLIVQGDNVILTVENNPLILGDTLYLSCHYPSSVASGVQLSIDGSLGGQGGKFNRITITSSDPGQVNYTFTSVTLTDQGTLFQCITSSTNGLSNVIYLTVFFPPSYSPSPFIPPLYNGTSSCILLNISSLPYPNNYSWIHNGVPLSLTNTTTATPHSLCFHSLSLNDSGNYTVSSSNIAGNGNVSFVLDIYYGPSFQEGSNITKWVEYSTDSNFTLSCTVILPNPPSFTLSFYNSTTSNTDNVYLLHDTDTLGEYTFVKGVVSNRGNYSCEAESDDGIITTLTYWLFVGGPPQATISANVSVNYYEVIINYLLTDTGSAPVTGLLFNINDYNRSVTLEYPVINSSILLTESFELDDILVDTNNTLSIGVYNTIGRIDNLFNDYFVLPSITVSSTLLSSMSSIIPPSSSTASTSSSSLSPSPTTSTSPTTSSSSTTSSSTPSTSTSSVTVSPSLSPPHHSKTNSGAIAAGIMIPLVFVVGVVVIGIVIFFILKWRNSRSKTQSVSTYEQIGGGGNSYESFIASLDDEQESD